MKIRTYKSLSKVSYPVFHIDAYPIEVDGLVFVNGVIVDDRNISRPTLGERRLLSPHKLHQIKRLRRNEIEIIKDKTVDPIYLDSAGSAFGYERTIYQTIKCHLIKKVIPKNLYSLLILDGIHFPIVVERPPVDNFARILYYQDLPWKLYDYSEIPVKNSRKKV